MLVISATMLMASATPAIAHSNSGSRTVKIERQIKQLKKHKNKYEGAIRFWSNKKHRWMLHPRQSEKPCWKLKLRGPLQLCIIGRRSVRGSSQKLKFVERRIQELSILIQPIGNRSHWECIYSYEHGPGGWSTNTGNGYYGGLQMDLDFQRAHGLDLLLRKGTANNWTIHEQMVVAERARRGIQTTRVGSRVVLTQHSPRGYYPWPRTARFCDLI
jgi:hypothetical protein